MLIRPNLRLNGIPVSIKRLEDVRLVINTADQDRIWSSMQVPNFKLFDDRESVHEFRVPTRLLGVGFALHAKVKALSLGKEIDLEVSQSFVIGEKNPKTNIEDLHLARFGDDYVIELLGLSGEPKADRPVEVAVRHREFREAVKVTLKTDVRGRINLGMLTDIVDVRADVPGGIARSWSLPLDRHSYRQVVHARAGDPIVLPYLVHRQNQCAMNLHYLKCVAIP